MSVVIFDILKGSYADKAKILAGETLVSINGSEIDDVLDFRFHEVNSKLILKIADKTGKERTVKIKKGEYDECGLLFETYLMDKQKSCKNKCIFCFVDQLPQGMRSSLYFKDDDTRLSFLFGNYVTLTNISEHEIERIIKMHISPINISVHTTNPELRVKMMANKNAGESLKILKRFADAGIDINCQLVLCPGINDGDELLRSLDDLSAFVPSVKSIALVPVGLTKHREKLYPLTPYNKEGALRVIQTAEQYAQRFSDKYGTKVVYASDEFYLKAAKELPSAEYYEDFCQLENGVGLIRLFEEDFESRLEDAEKKAKVLHLSFATGVDAAPFLSAELKKAQQSFEGLTFDVHAILNDFFGREITVAGLVTAGDIISQLKGKDLGDALIIPDVMLRHEKDKFLDDVSVNELSDALKVRVIVSKADGDGLFDTLYTLFNEEE